MTELPETARNDDRAGTRAGDSCRFPVRRVSCLGHNYADHAREMGHDPDRGNTVLVWATMAPAVDGRAPATELAKLVITQLYAP